MVEGVEGGRGSGAGGRPSSARGSRAGAGRRRTARTSEGQRAASPRPARSSNQPPKPQLPEERPKLPRDVYRDLKGAAREGTLDDVCAAFAAAGEALTRGDTDRALECLKWAKSVASRSAVIREALGVAFYNRGEFDAARSELQNYRRITGRADQNHLLADCVRVQGRSDKVAGYIDEMLDSGVPLERAAEGVIVLAGDRADQGDYEGALAALDRVSLEGVPVGEPHVRHWYMAAGLHERLGHHAMARDLLSRIAEVDDTYLDVAERLG